MDKKSIWEVILMPIAVAIIGIVGTWLVTHSQIESSKTVAKAQQKIKIIEIFSDKITEKDVTERTLAIKVLAAIDPELAQKITFAIADTDLDVKTDIDGMKSSLALQVQAEIKSELKSVTSENSKYLIGYYGLNLSAQEFQAVSNNLESSGYTIVTEELFEKKPEWMASQSTVLYYSSVSKEKANELAKFLSEVTNFKFQVQRGAGLGIPRGQEKKRFFVHYLK